MTLSDEYSVYFPMGEPARATHENTWDINDSNLPPPVKYDNFQEWPDSHCRKIYKEDVEDARRHLSGWAMRNTNNHNAHILKKSCIGIIVCNKDCTTEKNDKIILRPAICDKARRKQLGKPCPNVRCNGKLVLLPCRGHSGYPVTHFWRHCNGCVYFQSKGTHDHPKPEIKTAAEGKRRLQAIRPSTAPPLKPSRHGPPEIPPPHLIKIGSEIRGSEEMCSCPPFECVCRDSLIYGDVPSPVEHIQSYGETTWKPNGLDTTEGLNTSHACQSGGYGSQSPGLGARLHQHPTLKAEFGVYSCSPWEERYSSDYLIKRPLCDFPTENQLPELRTRPETSSSSIDYHGSFNCSIGESANSRQSCKLLEPSFNFTLTDNFILEAPTLQALDSSVCLFNDGPTECTLNIPSISTQTPTTTDSVQNASPVYRCSVDIGNKRKHSPEKPNSHNPATPFVYSPNTNKDTQLTPPKVQKSAEYDVKQPTFAPLEPVRHSHMFSNGQNIKAESQHSQEFSTCQMNDSRIFVSKANDCVLSNVCPSFGSSDVYSHLNTNISPEFPMEPKCKYGPHNCSPPSSSFYQQINTPAYNHNINITLQYK